MSTPLLIGEERRGSELISNLSRGNVGVICSCEYTDSSWLRGDPSGFGEGSAEKPTGGYHSVRLESLQEEATTENRFVFGFTALNVGLVSEDSRRWL